MTKKYAHLIVQQPTPYLDIPAHEVKAAQGFPVDLMCSAAQIPGAALCIGVRDFRALPDEIKASPADHLPVPHTHTHTVPQTYLLVGDPGAYTLRVELDDEVYELSPPATVYIPPGVPHRMEEQWVKPGAVGFLINIFLDGTYAATKVS